MRGKKVIESRNEENMKEIMKKKHEKNNTRLGNIAFELGKRGKDCWCKIKKRGE